MRAGLGKSELTPPLGVELSGYGYYLKRKAVSVNDPLYARALLLEDGTKRALVVSCDLLGLSAAVCAEIRAYAEEKLGCAAENVIIVSTHTHTGPAIIYHEGCGEPNAEYVKTVGRKILGALDAALDDLKTVTSLSFVMRELEGDYIYNRAVAGGPVDRMMRGFLLRREGARPVAILSSACHGVFRQRVPNVSADYAGQVNGMAGQAGYDSIYLNGLCGDIDPYKPSAERLNAYATEICALLREEETPLKLEFSAGRIDFHLRHTMTTPEEIRGAAKEAIGRAGEGDEGPVLVAKKWEHEMLSRVDELQEMEPLYADYLVLGGVPVLATPFEGYTKIGTIIREKLHRLDALILGCAEELKGYLPMMDDFERRSYAALESTFLYKRLPVCPGEAERVGEDLGEKLSKLLS